MIQISVFSSSCVLSSVLRRLNTAEFNYVSWGHVMKGLVYWGLVGVFARSGCNGDPAREFRSGLETQTLLHSIKTSVGVCEEWMPSREQVLGCDGAYHATPVPRLLHRATSSCVSILLAFIARLFTRCFFPRYLTFIVLSLFFSLIILVYLSTKFSIFCTEIPVLVAEACRF